MHLYDLFYIWSELIETVLYVRIVFLGKIIKKLSD